MSAPRRSLAAAALLAACTATASGNGTVPSEYLAPQWRIVAIDGQPFAARGTIDFSEPGRASGEAPCNRWTGSYEGPLPAFVLKGVAATRMACPDLKEEARFLQALSAMTEARTEGILRLKLTGPDGRSMEFVRPLN